MKDAADVIENAVDIEATGVTVDIAGDGSDDGGSGGGESFHIMLLPLPVINASAYAVLSASVSGDAKIVENMGIVAAGTVDIVVTGDDNDDVDAVSCAVAETVTDVVVAGTADVGVGDAVAMVEGLVLPLLPLLLWLQLLQ